MKSIKTAIDISKESAELQKKLDRLITKRDLVTSEAEEELLIKIKEIEGIKNPSVEMDSRSNCITVRYIIPGLKFPDVTYNYSMLEQEGYLISSNINIKDLRLCVDSGEQIEKLIVEQSEL